MCPTFYLGQIEMQLKPEYGRHVRHVLLCPPRDSRWRLQDGGRPARHVQALRLGARLLSLMLEIAGRGLVKNSLLACENRKSFDRLVVKITEWVK